MEDNVLKRFSTAKFLSFALGFFGLQFAWQMRIILSGPVTENLGASPFLFGLIWLAGPFTGMVVQPVIGALSDKTTSPFGRRRPYLLGGALLSALALWALPNSELITNFISSTLHIKFPALAALFFAAVMIWVLVGYLIVSAILGFYAAALLKDSKVNRKKYFLENLGLLAIAVFLIILTPNALAKVIFRIVGIIAIVAGAIIILVEIISSKKTVVVKPDDVSKNASINEGIAPLITKGSAPTTEINIHANPTVRNPSFAYISSLSVLILHKKIIIGNISTIVIKNDNASPSP